jgi:PKD repeat protein
MYQQAGTYPVTLSMMASNGCRDTIVSSIEITDYPNIGFYYNNACINSETTFIDTSICVNCNINNWQWTVNNSEFGTSDTAIYFFQDTGSYQIKLQVESTAGCIGGLSKTVFIGNKPQAIFNVEELFGSPPFNLAIANFSDSNLLFQWNFGNGDFSDLFQPNYTYQDTGIFILSLSVSDLNGCTDSSAQSLKVLPKKVDMAITNAQITESNGYINTELNILNLGTSRVYSFDILLNSNGFNNNTIENW